MSAKRRAKPAPKVVLGLDIEALAKQLLTDEVDAVSDGGAQ